MSVAEIQDRVKILISHLSAQSDLKSPFYNPNLMASIRKMIDPNLLNNEKVADEIITTFLNAIILAGQLGIDIEKKVNEYLIQLEREALMAM